MAEETEKFSRIKEMVTNANNYKFENFGHFLSVVKSWFSIYRPMSSSLSAIEPRFVSIMASVANGVTKQIRNLTDLNYLVLIWHHSGLLLFGEELSTWICSL